MLRVCVRSINGVFAGLRVSMPRKGLHLERYMLCPCGALNVAHAFSLATKTSNRTYTSTKLYKSCIFPMYVSTCNAYASYRWKHLDVHASYTPARTCTHMYICRSYLLVVSLLASSWCGRKPTCSLIYRRIYTHKKSQATIAALGAATYWRMVALLCEL